MWIVLTTQLLLLAVMSAGWFVGKAIYSVAVKKKGSEGIDGHDVDRLKEAIAFVSGAVGVMLGLLLSLSVSQFQDTQSRVNQLGSDSIAIFAATNNFPTEAANTVRHDVVCTLRTFVYQDWHASSEQKNEGREQTALWQLQLGKDVRALSIETDKESASYGVIVEKTMDIANQIDQISSSSTNTIPMVIWFVIYFAAFVLCALLAITAVNRKVLARLLFGVTYGTQAIILLALTVLDFPMQNLGFGTAVSVDTLQATYTNLEWQYPGEEWRECPTLNASDLVKSD